MPLPFFFFFLESVILTLPLPPSLTHTLIPFPIFLGLFLEAAGPASARCSLTLHLGLSNFFLSSSPSLSAAVEPLRA